ncbi:MAG: sensor histidine kinase [Hyphomicrobiales bacterium]
MRRNSLAFRLTASAAVVSLVLLILAGVLLSVLFRNAIERNFDARLQAILDGLLASVEVNSQGMPAISVAIADTRFRLPMSGWYWQVRPVNGDARRELVSESLLEHRLIPPDRPSRDPDGISRFYLTDPNGTRLRAVEQRFTLFGGNEQYSFTVAGNIDELKAEIDTFSATLWAVLSMLGLGLMATILVQVRYGLRPMRQMHDELADIRAGNAERLTATYPEEIEPVAEELNLLIQSNTEVVERARTQVGNLAHALKTPLSVLANEARLSGDDLGRKVEAQTQVMRDQVNMYLDRARRAARARTLGASTEAKDVLEALARTLLRIHQERNLTCTVDCPAGLKVRCEQQDLEEMAGNLMDNAFKWAKSAIAVSATTAADGSGRSWVVLSVGDDGPGLPRERREEAVQRGKRLDETKPGSGLGLNIVSETAAMYGGTLALDQAPLGGLQATVRLPAA